MLWLNDEMEAPGVALADGDESAATDNRHLLSPWADLSEPGLLVVLDAREFDEDDDAGGSDDDDEFFDDEEEDEDDLDDDLDDDFDDDFDADEEEEEEEEDEEL